MTRIPSYEEPEWESSSAAFWRDPSKLPPQALLSDDWWPEAKLVAAMRHRRSRLPWRRRRSYDACRWLIARREVACGLREQSILEILMR